jgi:hypothetical protein
MTATGLRIAVTGRAVVCCVHDRQKRQIVTEEQVAELGLEIGVVFKKGIHHVHQCACCENLFVADGTTERYCTVCSGSLIHALGGPLAEPKGVVS